MNTVTESFSHIITDKLILAVGVAAVIVTACMPAPAAADTLDNLSVVAHTVSKHSSTTDNYNFNETNLGIALKLQLNHDWSIQSGVYKNSYYKTTVYTGLQYTPLHFGNVSIGGFTGLATGYNHVSQLNIGRLSVVGGLYANVELTNTTSIAVRAVPKIGPNSAGVISAEFAYKF